MVSKTSYWCDKCKTETRKLQNFNHYDRWSLEYFWEFNFDLCKSCIKEFKKLTQDYLNGK